MIKKNTLIVILSVLVFIFGISLVVFESGVLESKNAKEANKTEISNKKEQEVDSEKKEEEKVEPPTEELEKENNDDNEEEKGLDNYENNKDEVKPEKEPVIEIPETSTIVNKKITIDNRCDITAQAFEKIYEDSNYTYYLSTISSGCIYVKINGNEYTLKKAINEKIVTVYELEENGFRFIKEERNIVSR